MSSPRLVRLQALGVLASLALAGAGLSAAEPASAARTGSGSAVVQTTVGWRQVDAGRHHTCAIRTDGRLYCWGWGNYGQLGYGGNADQPEPVQVAGNRTDWATVAAGSYHTCARRTNGRLYCWGYDGDGQLGNGSATTDSQPTPVQVAGNRTDWATVTAGEGHTCARRTDRRLYCWGDDWAGQIGDGGTNTDQPAPVQVAGNLTDWASVTAGYGHTCARRTTGRLYCWGYDGSGQIGDGSGTTEQPAPAEVAGNRTDWASVAAGENHTCARRTTGRLYCWGYDGYGQLGNGSGTTDDQPTPVQITGNRTDWATVTAGSDHTCARRTDRRLYCWGDDSYGQIGDGSATNNPPTPVQVAGNRTDWATVAAGSYHTCARRTTGGLYCWGYDANGQVGDGGTNTNRSTPVQVTL